MEKDVGYSRSFLVASISIIKYNSGENNGEEII